MKYTVVWKPAAEAQLANLWTNSANRGDIAAAADLIDVLLSQQPSDEGEPRPEAMRVLIIPPLAVNYRVSDLDRMVWVADVWRWSAATLE